MQYQLHWSREWGYHPWLLLPFHRILLEKGKHNPVQKVSTTDGHTGLWELSALHVKIPLRIQGRWVRCWKGFQVVEEHNRASACHRQRNVYEIL